MRSASLSIAACAASFAECPLRHTNVSTIPSSNRFHFVLMVLCRACIACREVRYRDEHQPLRRLTMSIIDKALEANRNYAKTYDPTNANRPAPKIVVVTCMDPRLSTPPTILAFPRADIDVTRPGDPAVTDDVLGELVVSNRVL